MKTHCKDCVFAEYTDKTQNGCALDMLSKFTKIGTQIDECYDEEKEFYVIHGLCIKKVPISLIEDKEKAKKFVETLCNVSWQVIVDGTDNLEKTLDSINVQESKPYAVTVISYNNEPVTRITKLVKRRKFKKWRVQVAENTNFLPQLDIAIDKYNNIPIYITVKSGETLDDDLIKNLNNIIYNKLLTLGLYIEYKEKNINICSMYLHKMLNGNAFDIPLKKKIKEKEWGKVIHNYLEIK